jgi:hypothetical protein
MKNYYLCIVALSAVLGVYSVLDGFYSPILIASIISIPIYMYGNKLAVDKGLDTSIKGEVAKDPFSRLKNWGMSALPLLSVIVSAVFAGGNT